MQLAECIYYTKAMTMKQQPYEEPIFADERQQQIADLVVAHGKVRTAHLTQLFGVTEPTLRKDLSVLEERGLLKRTHGGAVSIRPPREQEVANRAAHHAEAKQAIALACLQEIGERDAIFLDGGTTVFQIARNLERYGRYVTVLTNAPAVAEIVANLPNVTHVLLGGYLRRISGSLVGPLALENLARFTINTAFIGVGGLSESGCTVADLNEAQLKATVIAQAQRVILPLDHTKVGAVDFARVCEIDAIDVVVTDQENLYLQKWCSSHNIRLVVASPKSPRL
ncbi:MAG: DeoR/GlpR family DNA-binding transcription regulator [Ktedonobacteraceae bacterium]